MPGKLFNKSKRVSRFIKYCRAKNFFYNSGTFYYKIWNNYFRIVNVLFF